MRARDFTERDIFLIRKAYKNQNGHKRINFSQELLGRHSKRSCFTKAGKLKIKRQHHIAKRIDMKSWPNTDLAYLAGIVDGEGCIHYDKNTKCLKLAVTNTDIGLLDWLKKRIGAGAYYHKNITKADHHQKCYHFVVSAIRDVLDILKAIEPYVIIKKEKVLYGIKILEAKLV